MSPRLAAVLLLVAAPLCAQVNLQNLLSNSPFGQAKAGPPEEAPTAWEFRGVAEENGETWFSLFDSTAKRSVWVRQGESPEGLVVRSFDPGAMSLTVEHQFRALTLPLKRAPQAALPSPTQPVLASGIGPGNNPPNANAAPAAGATLDAQQRQRFEEEIRRRRALRQQMAQSPDPAANP